jgi:hypothetical protein
LSQDAVKFLRALRAQVKSPSISALFERIIGDLKRKREIEQFNKRVAAYYDSLSDTERREDTAWGQLGESALVDVEPELAPDEH